MKLTDKRIIKGLENGNCYTWKSLRKQLSKRAHIFDYEGEIMIDEGLGENCINFCLSMEDLKANDVQEYRETKFED